MRTSKELQALNEAIGLLRIRRQEELSLMRDQFHITYESLKPINLLKHTFKEAVSAPGIIEVMLSTAIGLASGYFTKTIIVGASKSPVNKILGTLLQFTISTLTSNNSGTIKWLKESTVDRIFRAPVGAVTKISENAGV
jgi:hypothetical protein